MIPSGFGRPVRAARPARVAHQLLYELVNVQELLLTIKAT